MTRGWTWILALALASGSAGCMAYGGGKASKVDPNAVATTAASTSALNGTRWRIEEINGQAVLDRSATSLKIGRDGSLSGSTGCNEITGHATIDADKVSLSPMASTQKSCEPGAASQETSLFKAMADVQSYAMDANGGLVLKGADGTALVRLSRAH